MRQENLRRRTRVAASLLFGVSPADPAAALAVAALPLVVLVTSLLPAWRATRITLRRSCGPA